jgi:hypothetical protein
LLYGKQKERLHEVVNCVDYPAARRKQEQHPDTLTVMTTLARVWNGGGPQRRHRKSDRRQLRLQSHIATVAAMDLTGREEWPAFSTTQPQSGRAGAAAKSGHLETAVGYSRRLGHIV